MWPDEETQTTCQVIPPTYLKFTDPIGIALSIVAGFGVIICISVLGIFTWKRQTKLVKASNRQLTALMLIGGAMACGLLFIFMVKPSVYSCGVRQTGFHLTVSLLYCPIFVKASRVYRVISAGQKGVKLPRFISSGWQTVLTSTAIGIQV